MKMIAAVLIGAFAWQEPLWYWRSRLSASCYMTVPEVGADSVRSLYLLSGASSGAVFFVIENLVL